MRQVQSIHSVAFAMAISLTLFACSDSSSGDDNEVSSSSSELNEESSSSAEDLSSSSEAESSSSEAESSSSEVSSSSSFEEDGTLGTLDDDRDDKTYRTVVIGTQVWMAENLNFDTKSDGSVCYGNDDDANCTTYGKLYDWATATTACPGGWNLPSDAEWTTLTNYVGGSSTAGSKLKATSGWDSYSSIPLGTDDYSFSALPGGYGYSSGAFYNVGKYGTWWSATENNASNAYYRRMQYSNESMDRVNYGEVDGLFSVRCLKN